MTGSRTFSRGSAAVRSSLHIDISYCSVQCSVKIRLTEEETSEV